MKAVPALCLTSCLAASSAARPNASLEREGRYLSHLQLMLVNPPALVQQQLMPKICKSWRANVMVVLVQQTCILADAHGVGRMATAISTTMYHAASCQSEQRVTPRV